MYFRELTEAAHNGAGQLTNLPSSRGAWLLPAQTEGFYTTVAMVNAYFSYLEHLFVLMLPFSDFDRSKNDLVSFIRSNWGNKYKRIIPPKESQEAERFCNRLRAIAEEFRNTHVHGGFNKESHGGLIVHCSGGALHADMSAQRGKPYYELVPVDEGDFEHVCATLTSSIHGSLPSAVIGGLPPARMWHLTKHLSSPTPPPAMQNSRPFLSKQWISETDT